MQSLAGFLFSGYHVESIDAAALIVQGGGDDTNAESSGDF
jgi:hypothetical protein